MANVKLVILFRLQIMRGVVLFPFICIAALVLGKKARRSRDPSGGPQIYLLFSNVHRLAT